MCDYSLESIKSRDAVEGEDLVAHRFNTGTVGFISKDDPDCAVCCKSGVEMTCYIEGAFNTGKDWNDIEKVTLTGETPVVFHTLIIEGLRHKDGLILPDGKFLNLQKLLEGMRVTVTKALPKEIVEAAKGEKAFDPDLPSESVTGHCIVAGALVD